jgi:hypothetical protein
MLRFSLSYFWWFVSFFRSRQDVGLELIALRPQLSVLKRKNPRPGLKWSRSAAKSKPTSLTNKCNSGETYTSSSSSSKVNRHVQS